VLVAIPDRPISFEVFSDDFAGMESQARQIAASGENVYVKMAYPQPSAQAFRTYDAYVDRGRKIPNLRYVGRHAEFKYWGMAETVNSAYLKSREFEPV
jgi:UDP-galactopyranose mutase